MPHGFPAAHPRFWTNEVFAPAAGVLLLVALLGAFSAKLASTFERALAFVAVGWLTVGVVVAITFPTSGGRAAVAALACGVSVLLVARLASRQLRRALVQAAPFALLVGATTARAQRAEPPSTRPLDVPLVALSNARSDVPDHARVDPRVSVDTAQGLVSFEGDARLFIRPLLTFVSRSPDGFWTLFASAADRVGPHRRRTGWRQDADRLAVSYEDDGLSRLDVATTDSTTVLEAWTHLARPVDAHLVSLTEVALVGATPPLTVAFSPCAVPIEILPSDYPVGRPARFAYLDASGRFHVCQATSGEKGPFHELAAGALGRAEPLELTLSSAGVPLYRLTFHDFAAQASVALSPTAGWGIPVNAIEFRLGSGGEAELFLELAASSVGRGWDSVGHAAGTYRNRVVVKALR